MSNAMKQHGAFSWNELMTTDVEGAKAFYQQLFGWTFEEMNPTEMPYHIAKAGETETAGVMGMPPEAEGMPPAWGAYVTVDDVDASAAKAEALGAKIVVPLTDIPKVGRFCVIVDSQGAALSLITYSDEACDD